MYFCSCLQVLGGNLPLPPATPHPHPAPPQADFSHQFNFQPVEAGQCSLLGLLRIWSGASHTIPPLDAAIIPGWLLTPGHSHISGLVGLEGGLYAKGDNKRAYKLTDRIKVPGTSGHEANTNCPGSGRRILSGRVIHGCWQAAAMLELGTPANWAHWQTGVAAGSSQ